MGYDIDTVPADVKAKVASLQVKQVAITEVTKNADDMKTSYTHNFKPPVSLEEAVKYLNEKEGNTAQVLFTNFRFSS